MSRNETKNRIDFMLLDTDFFEKPENVEAVDKFGDVAPAAIMRLCLKLMNENEASMRKSQVLAMWRASGTDQAVWAEIIEYYISCGWLVEQNDCICSTRVGQERARVIKKRDQLSANAKQKQSKCLTEPEQTESKSTDTDTVTDPEVLDLKETVTEDPPSSIRPGPFKILCFNQIQWETLQVQESPEILNKQIELYEAYVMRHKRKDPQRFRELCQEASEGAACLMSWAKSAAYTQIANQTAAKARVEKATKPFQKPEEAPRVQPQIFKPPPKQPPLTEEQKAENKRKVAELITNISSKKKVA